jgi:hypothetical protein
VSLLPLPRPELFGDRRYAPEGPELSPLVPDDHPPFGLDPAELLPLEPEAPLLD